jgi:hypothetical protein
LYEDNEKVIQVISGGVSMEVLLIQRAKPVPLTYSFEVGNISEWDTSSIPWTGTQTPGYHQVTSYKTQVGNPEQHGVNWSASVASGDPSAINLQALDMGNPISREQVSVSPNLSPSRKFYIIRFQQDESGAQVDKNYTQERCPDKIYRVDPDSSSLSFTPGSYEEKKANLMLYELTGSGQYSLNPVAASRIGYSIQTLVGTGTPQITIGNINNITGSNYPENTHDINILYQPLNENSEQYKISFSVDEVYPEGENLLEINVNIGSN